MKYCSNCGKEVDPNAVVCIHCGVQLQAMNNNATSTSDNGSFLWSVLGFFVPIVGLILWLVWKDSQPNNSRAAKKGFIAYLILCAVMFVFMMVIGMIASASLTQ